MQCLFDGIYCFLLCEKIFKVFMLVSICIDRLNSFYLEYCVKDILFNNLNYDLVK